LRRQSLQKIGMALQPKAGRNNLFRLMRSSQNFLQQVSSLKQQQSLLLPPFPA